jgi:phage baseplate assembly protein V
MRTPEDHHTDPDELIRFGTVASVDAAAARCVVRFDDDLETPSIRWLAPRMGETSAWFPPSVGEQVAVLCPAGEVAGGVVVGGMTSNSHPAPATTAAPLIRFADGAVLTYDPTSHQLTFALPDGATMAIEATGGVTIDGPVSINGDTIITGTLTASTDVVGGGKSLKGHKHSGVSAGGAQTGAPV